MDGDRRAIGLFDSGAGGLHVATAVNAALPRERLVYLADTARLPYGPRPPAEIRRFALELAGALLRRDVKLLVVACNSAESAAWDELVRWSPVPLVGVIGPAVDAALAATRSGVLGLIGTEATIAGGAYQRAVAGRAAGVSVRLHARAAPALGELLHRPVPDAEVRAAVRAAVEPLRREGIDTLILGCTAYPMAEAVVRDELGAEVAVVSSAGPTAAAVLAMVSDRRLAAPAGLPADGHEVLVTGDVAAFAPLAAAVARFPAAVRSLDGDPAGPGLSVGGRRPARPRPS